MGYHFQIRLSFCTPVSLCFTPDKDTGYSPCPSTVKYGLLITKGGYKVGII